MDGHMDDMQHKMDGHMDDMQYKMDGHMDDMQHKMDECPLSPGIAAEEDRVRRRRSTLGTRRSVGTNRLSLAAPPPLALQDQVLDVEESWSWTTKLNYLLDIALREAVRKLETRLPDDECVPELRAAIITQTNSMARQLSTRVCDLTPAAAATPALITSSSSSVEVYKEKTKGLHQEYNKWKAMRRQREAECNAAEIEFQEAKSGVTTVDEGQEVQLSLTQRNLLDTWTDCSQYVEEAQHAMEKACLAFEEIRHTTDVVNGFLTASRLQADSIYLTLESLNDAHIKTQPLTLVMNDLLQVNLICRDGEKEASH